MTAIAVARNTPRKGTEPFPGLISADVYTATTILEGTIVAIDTTHGYAVAGATSTSMKVIGVARETVVNAGASGAKKVECIQGIHKFANSAASDAITNAECMQLCYLVDNQTVSKTNLSNTASPAGVVYYVDADGVWVWIGALPHLGVTYATVTGGETLTNKTLTAPTITTPTITVPVISATGWTNAGHTHAGTTSGGLIPVASLVPGAVAHRKLRVNSAATTTELGGDVLLTGVAATMTSDSTTIVVTESGTHYNVLAPFSANPQSICLSLTNAIRGWYVVFTADGTLNTQTVTYKSVATAITGALTANKTHAVIMFFTGVAWVALSDVMP